MEENTAGKLETITNKCTEGFAKFSNSKSGNLILDFVMFKKNLIPYTLQILYVLGVLAAWIVAILGIVKQGPIASFCVNLVTKDGKTVESFDFLMALGLGVAIILFAPFVLHYALELAKIAWRLAVHVYEKILVPIWNTLAIRFFADVAPQILPFMYERFMKLVDICINKFDLLLDAVIGGVVAVALTISAVLKGVVWLPKNLCQGLAKWLAKSSEGDAAKQAK